MYYFGVIIPAKLSLTWDAVIGAITLIGFFWGIYKIIGSKVSKARYYEDLKQIRKEMEDLKTELEENLEKFKVENMGSHGKLSAETEKYFQILKDQMQQIFDIFGKKIDILLEHAIKK